MVNKPSKTTGVKPIDTAALYGASEQSLGDTGAATRFTIDTKSPDAFNPRNLDRGGSHGQLRGEHEKSANRPRRRVLYARAGPSTARERNPQRAERAVQARPLSTAGHIQPCRARRSKRWCAWREKTTSSSPPSIRGTTLPWRVGPTTISSLVVRKHDMAFYAYSPIAGGFLAKSKEALTEAGGRFGESQPVAAVYNAMYNRPRFVAVLDVRHQIARDEGVSRSELAYRWVAYHSALEGGCGDTILVGARNVQQLTETVRAVKAGPLGNEAAERIDAILESVKADAWLDNSQMLTSQ